MILIVEDDEHKSSQILEIIKSNPEYEENNSLVDNVRDAVRFLIEVIPEKIVLDMSLPSHKSLPGHGNPVPLPTGGIELLFEIKKRGLIHLPVLILTQYPEIDIEDEPIPVEESASAFQDEYGFTQLEAYYYDQINDSEWKSGIQRFLLKK
ncbi:response regulator [Vibrio alginolyticus]|uniref:response regulator n=1 Tax=Vibrio alginolyticus TaxID=663 RepID=UPI0006A77D13|nr:response regulator [Vibrio alginolyticus]